MNHAVRTAIFLSIGIPAFGCGGCDFGNADRPRTSTSHTTTNGTRDQQTTNSPPPPNLGPAFEDGKTVTNSIEMQFVPIPAGEFLMGSPSGEDHRVDNERQHPVRITKPFYLGATEVTQGQWKDVMGTEPWSGKKGAKEGSACAATFISWDDAAQFCKKLSPKQGWVYRLPTEAQWEYACRAGSKTAYCFGDDPSELGSYAWCDGGTHAHEVATKSPNAWGLYDMHGNVNEWCADWFGPDYPADSPDDPTGPTTGRIRVLRGGAWNGNARYCRSANRAACAPALRDLNGFRMVLVPSQ